MQNWMSKQWDGDKPWPSIVYVETTNFCNANCVSCLNDRCKRNRGIMTLEDFKKIADKIKAKGLKIGAMFCFGEPLLDDTICEKYAYAREIGVLTDGHVGLNTNVSKLTPEKYDKILNNTTNIILSFFNTHIDFERLTGGLNWDECYHNAKRFIEYRDKTKPDYPIFIGCNDIKGSSMTNVKEAFRGYNVTFVHDAELRWGGSVITGVIDRTIMYNHWRCDGHKGALQIKWNGDCEFCAYDIIGTDEGVGETKFGNILNDSWEELENKFKTKWRNGCSLCKRCDYWHRFKDILDNNYKRPDPLPDNWYDWQKEYLKPEESFVD